MSRRDLLRRALLVTGSVPLAATSLLALGCSDSDSDSAPAATVTTPPPTPAPSAATSGVIHRRPRERPRDRRNGRALSRRRGSSSRATWRGLAKAGLAPASSSSTRTAACVDHIRDVARRYAKEGFVALAVDMASRGGGSTADTPAEPGLLNQVSAEDHVKDLQADHRLSEGAELRPRRRLRCHRLLLRRRLHLRPHRGQRRHQGSVPYYGTAARAISNGLDRTKAAVLVMYGGADTRITGERGQVETALKTAGADLRDQGLRRRGTRLLQRHRRLLQRSRGQRRLDHDPRLVPQVPGVKRREARDSRASSFPGSTSKLRPGRGRERRSLAARPARKSG